MKEQLKDPYHDCGHRPRNTDKRKRSKPKEAIFVPNIGSAYLCLRTAQSDVESAQDAWCNEKWDDCLMWIRNAISQLQSSAAKIEHHKNTTETPSYRKTEIP